MGLLRLGDHIELVFDYLVDFLKALAFFSPQAFGQDFVCVSFLESFEVEHEEVSVDDVVHFQVDGVLSRVENLDFESVHRRGNSVSAFLDGHPLDFAHIVVVANQVAPLKFCHVDVLFAAGDHSFHQQPQFLFRLGLVVLAFGLLVESDGAVGQFALPVKALFDGRNRNLNVLLPVFGLALVEIRVVGDLFFLLLDDAGPLVLGSGDHFTGIFAVGHGDNIRVRGAGTAFDFDGNKIVVVALLLQVVALLESKKRAINFQLYFLHFTNFNFLSFE